MKRIISLALILMFALTLVGCAKTPATNNTDGASDNNDAQTTTYADATEVIGKVYAALAETDKFMAFGGDESNFTDNAPGKYDVTKKEELDTVLALPASQAENITDAASLVHGMLANNFTGACYKIKEGTDAKVFAEDYKKGLDTRHWMCGFPEKFAVIQEGDYVITVFGNGQLIDAFKTKALEVLGNSTVLSEGNVTVE